MGLPNKPFLFNFNAKNYELNGSGVRLLRENNQILQKDLALGDISVVDDHLYKSNSEYTVGLITNSSVPLSDFKITADDDFTLIYKIDVYYNIIPIFSINSSNNQILFFYEDGLYTYYPQMGYKLRLQQDYSKRIHTIVFRQKNRSIEIYCPETGERTTAQDYIDLTGSEDIRNICILGNSYGNTARYFPNNSSFYYIYAAKTALTDEEIQQVINYNEYYGSFAPSQSSFELDSEGETVSFDLAATDLNWTADIADNWVKLSKTSGYGDDTLSISCGLNTTGALRETTITFTSSEGDSFIISVSQPKFNKLWNKKLFRNNTVIKKIYRSGDLIYKRVAVRPTLVLDKDSIKLTGTGGSDTITVQSNTKVTATPSADWITVTKNGNIFTVSVEAETEKREGTILFKADNGDFITTASVAVKQQNNSYTIDLNNEWIETGTTEGYVTYASNSNHNIANGQAKAYIDIDGYTEFKIMVRTQGESNYDYLTVSELDKTPTRSNSTGGTTGNIWTGYGKASATTWYEVIYYNIDGGAHRITLLYAKDGSVNTEPDRGYFYIPEQ